MNEQARISISHMQMQARKDSAFFSKEVNEPLYHIMGPKKERGIISCVMTKKTDLRDHSTSPLKGRDPFFLHRKYRCALEELFFSSLVLTAVFGKHRLLCSQLDLFRGVGACSAYI